MITKKITHEESIIMKKSFDFFRELFENDLNGKPLEFVIEVLGNAIIFALSNTCIQLVNNSHPEAFHFINQISDAAKKEYLKACDELFNKGKLN